MAASGAPFLTLPEGPIWLNEYGRPQFADGSDAYDAYWRWQQGPSASYSDYWKQEFHDRDVAGYAGTGGSGYAAPMEAPPPQLTAPPVIVDERSAEATNPLRAISTAFSADRSAPRAFTDTGADALKLSLKGAVDWITDPGGKLKQQMFGSGNPAPQQPTLVPASSPTPAPYTGGLGLPNIPSIGETMGGLFPGVFPGYAQQPQISGGALTVTAPVTMVQRPSAPPGYVIIRGGTKQQPTYTAVLANVAYALGLKKRPTRRGGISGRDLRTAARVQHTLSKLTVGRKPKGVKIRGKKR